jgi:glycosyltransferase involved in cell wall biosynthesis
VCNSEIQLSIITLSLNQGLYITQNIESVKEFLNIGVEHIFIDPGSKDDSRTIIDSYANTRPNVLRIYEKDSGPAEGLNKGLRIAKGKWIAILNADDYYYEGSIGIILKYILKFNKYDILYGYGGLLEGQKLSKVHVGRLNLRNFALGQQQIFQPSIFFRKSKIMESGIVFNELNKTCWDAEFVFDILKSGNTKFKRLPIYFGVFRLHPNSISGSQRNLTLYNRDITRITKMAQINRNKKMDLIAHKIYQNKVFILTRKIPLNIFRMYYALKVIYRSFQ